MTMKGKNGGTLKPQRRGEPSHNPNGRGKGTLNAKTIIARWLETSENVQNPISKVNEKLTQLDLITLAQIKKARSGDTSAFNALLDRFAGKPPQEIQNTGKDGAALPAPRVTIIENN
jgi:hypothetical protein